MLECAKGHTNREVARRLGVSEPTVCKWRRRFIAGRLEGLHDEPRPGVPRSITDDHVDALIVATLEETPTDATHWSTRSMAQGHRHERIVGRADLAGVRIEAPPGRLLQAPPTPSSSKKSVTWWVSI